MYRRLIWWSAIGFCVPIAWGIMLPTLSSDWLTLWQVEAWRVAWVPGCKVSFPVKRWVPQVPRPPRRRHLG
jgi:hypothetical protein